MSERTEPDFDALRGEFPTLECWVYLDIARKAPTPRCVEAATRQFLDDIYEHAGQKAFSMDAVDETRKALAGLLGVQPTTLAFVKNTSEGLNLAVRSIPLAPGENIVTSAMEHEALLFSLQMVAQEQGVEIRIAPAREGRVPARGIADLMDGRTRVCAVSNVAYGNGFRFDMPALSAICRSRDVILVCDAIQAVGIMATPLPEIGADIVVCGCHKGLLGLNGTAFMYCREDLIEQLRPPFAGKHSVISDRLASAPLKFRSDARRFEYGNPNFLGIAALGHNVAFLRSIGLRQIEQRVHDLTDYLISQALSRDLTITTPLARSERAGIVSFDLPGDADAISRMLMDRKIVANVKDGQVRASVHFYNSHYDLDRFLDAIAPL